MIGIYKIENLVNHKVYIGQTIDFTHRTYLHTHYLTTNRHYNLHLQAAWNKYGSQNFKFELIKDFTVELQNVSQQEQKRILDDAERYYIKQYNASNCEHGYNLSEGGDGATLLGDRNPRYGKPRSDEVKRKISKTIKENKSHMGENNGRYGKPVSDLTRQKISEANSGRVQSDWERKIRSIAMQKSMENPLNQEMRKRVGIKNRKYDDDLVRKLRLDYEKLGSIKGVAELHNLNYEICRQIIRKCGRFAEID